MTGEPTTQLPEPPPLRIHHLLIWMTVTAAPISGCMWFDRTMRNGPPIENKIVIAGLILDAVSIAGLLTFAGLSIYWSDRAYPFPTAPGEWLLWVVSHGVASMIVAFIGIFIAFAIDDDALPLYYIVVGLLLVGYWARLNTMGILRYSDSRAWRCVFALLALTLIAAPLVRAAWPMAFFLSCLLWAAIGDWRRAAARSWIHWLGVILALTLGCGLIITFDVWQLFR